MSTEYMVLLPSVEQRWLDATPEQKAAVYGRHRQFAEMLAQRGHTMTGGSELAPSSEEPRDLDPKAVEGLAPAIARAAAGEVVLLHPMAPHRSGPNRSGRSRRIVTYVYTLERNAGASARYYTAIQSR